MAVVKLTELNGASPSQSRLAVNHTELGAGGEVWEAVAAVRSSAEGRLGMARRTWLPEWPSELNGRVPGTPGWAGTDAGAIHVKPGEGFGLPGDVDWTLLRDRSPRARVANALAVLYGLLSGAVLSVYSGGRGADTGAAADGAASGARDFAAEALRFDTETASMVPARSKREAGEPARATAVADVVRPPVDETAQDTWAGPRFDGRRGSYTSLRDVPSLSGPNAQRFVNRIKTSLRHQLAQWGEPVQAEANGAQWIQAIYRVVGQNVSPETERTERTRDLVRPLLRQRGHYGDRPEQDVPERILDEAFDSLLFLLALGEPSPGDALVKWLNAFAQSHPREAFFGPGKSQAAGEKEMRALMADDLRSTALLPPAFRADLAEEVLDWLAGRIVGRAMPMLHSTVDPANRGRPAAFGDMEWVTYKLAEKWLSVSGVSSVPGASQDMPSSTSVPSLNDEDPSVIAGLALELEAATGTVPELAAYYYAMALVHAVCSGRAIDWPATGELDEQKRITQAFASFRSAYWGEQLKFADDVARAVEYARQPPSRAQLARSELRKLRLYPDRAWQKRDDRPGAPPGMRVSTTWLNEYLSGGADRVNGWLKRTRYMKDKAVPDIEARYANEVDTYVSRLGGLYIPLFVPVLEHGLFGGGGDTALPDDDAAHASAWLERVASGTAYTKDDRRFLIDALNSGQMDLLTPTLVRRNHPWAGALSPKSPLRLLATLTDMREEVASMRPDTLLLRASLQPGASRDYVLRKLEDGRFAITRLYLTPKLYGAWLSPSAVVSPSSAYLPQTDWTLKDLSDHSDSYRAEIERVRAGHGWMDDDEARVAAFVRLQLGLLFPPDAISATARARNFALRGASAAQPAWRLDPGQLDVTNATLSSDDRAIRQTALALGQQLAKQMRAPVYHNGYDMTDDQRLRELTMALLKSVVPLWMCIEQAREGDAAGATASCTMDVVNVLFIGAPVVGVAAKGASAAKVAAALGKQVAVQFDPGLGLLYAGMRGAGRAGKSAIQLLRARSGSVRVPARLERLSRAFSYMRSGQRRLVVGGDEYSYWRLKDSPENLIPVRPVRRTDAGTQWYAQVDVGTGLPFGPYLKAVRVPEQSGREPYLELASEVFDELEPMVLPAQLPLQAEAGGTLRVRLPVGQTVRGDDRMLPVADLRAMQMPGKPNRRLFKIGDEHYALTLPKSGEASMALVDTAELVPRQEGRRISHAAEVDNERGELVLKPQPAGKREVPARMLHADGPYQRFAVSLPGNPEPDAFGVIRHEGLNYIRIEEDAAEKLRYYLLDRRAGQDYVVNPQRRFGDIEIPVFRDFETGRWSSYPYGLSGGSLSRAEKKQLTADLKKWQKTFERAVALRNVDQTVRENAIQSARRGADTIRWILRAQTLPVPSRVEHLVFRSSGDLFTGLFPVFLLEPNERWQAGLQGVTALEIDVEHLDKATVLSRLARGQTSRRPFYFGNWANLKKLTLGGRHGLRDLKTFTLGRRLNSLEELMVRSAEVEAIRFDGSAQAAPSLNALYLHANRRLNEIPDLSGATTLKHVAIERNPKLKALSDVANCPSLETLKYAYNGNGEGLLPDLSRLTQMTRLDLRVPGMVRVTGLEHMQHLKELRLDHIAEPLALYPNARLEVLDVGGEMGGLLLPDGVRMDTLGTLVRSRSGAARLDLQSLARTPQLKKLRLDDVAFERGTLVLNQGLAELREVFVLGRRGGLSRVYVGRPAGNEAVAEQALLENLKTIEIHPGRDGLDILALANIPSIELVSVRDCPYPRQIVLDGRHDADEAVTIALGLPVDAESTALPEQGDRPWLTLEHPNPDERTRYVFDLRNNNIATIPASLMNDRSLVGVEFSMAGNPLDDATQALLARRSVMQWPRFSVTNVIRGERLDKLLQKSGIDQHVLSRAQEEWKELQQLGNARDENAGLEAVEAFRRTRPDGGFSLIPVEGHLSQHDVQLLEQNKPIVSLPLSVEAALSSQPAPWREALERQPLEIQKAMENWRKAVAAWRRDFNAAAGSVVTLLARADELPEMRSRGRKEAAEWIAATLHQLHAQPEVFRTIHTEDLTLRNECEDRVMGELNRLDLILQRARYAYAGGAQDTNRLFQTLRGEARFEKLNAWVVELLKTKHLEANESVEVVLYLAKQLEHELEMPQRFTQMQYRTFAEYQLWLCYARDLGIEGAYDSMREAEINRILAYAKTQALQGVLDNEDVIRNLIQREAWRDHLDSTLGWSPRKEGEGWRLKQQANDIMIDSLDFPDGSESRLRLERQAHDLVLQGEAMIDETYYASTRNQLEGLEGFGAVGGAEPLPEI
jgi:hypothetical protein